MGGPAQPTKVMSKQNVTEQSVYQHNSLLRSFLVCDNSDMYFFISGLAAFSPWEGCFKKDIETHLKMNRETKQKNKKERKQQEDEEEEEEKKKTYQAPHLEMSPTCYTMAAYNVT